MAVPVLVPAQIGWYVLTRNADGRFEDHCVIAWAIHFEKGRYHAKPIVQNSVVLEGKYVLRRPDGTHDMPDGSGTCLNLAEAMNLSGLGTVMDRARVVMPPRGGEK